MTNIATAVTIDCGNINIQMQIGTIGLSDDDHPRLQRLKDVLAEFTAAQFWGEKQTATSADNIKAFLDTYAPLLYLLSQLGVNI